MTITILLTDLAPKTLDPDEWPVLVQTPEEKSAAQFLAIRVKGAMAVVYGSKGAGVGAFEAGLYAGRRVPLKAQDGSLNYDNVVAAIFEVGKELTFDKQMLWGLVRQLPAHSL